MDPLEKPAEKPAPRAKPAHNPAPRAGYKVEVGAIPASVAEPPAPEPAPAPTPRPAPAPVPVPEKLWRVEIRHTPCGAHARQVRTQSAPTPEAAWEKFKVAVAASMAQAQTTGGRETLKAWEAWLAEFGGTLPKAHGRVITEEQAREELKACLAVAKAMPDGPTKAG
jgi:hypothetical protein